MTSDNIKSDIFPYLSPKIRQYLLNVEDAYLNNLHEIRIGINKPVMLVFDGKVYFLDKNYNLTKSYKNCLIIEQAEIEKTLEFMTKSSVYAAIDDLKKGFLTISGGYRVGICGRCVFDNDKISYIKNISYLNIRIKREVKGCAEKIIQKIINGDDIKNTLIAGRVKSGKTTLIRDIARILSDSFSKKVSIADERGEIAALDNGSALNDVGILTSVMEFCPKIKAMTMLIRSMSPDVIITDEIGSDEDIIAIKKALLSGVKIITTIHADKKEDLKMYENIFDIIVILDGDKKGEIKEIIGD
ncbi:MAG: stage III sporulation protein AA [Ruminococcaceae bacterium]|nr:stage III sporulation protein AA [Oscillospiraceae bacterium]